MKIIHEYKSTDYELEKGTLLSVRSSSERDLIDIQPIGTKQGEEKISPRILKTVTAECSEYSDKIEIEVTEPLKKGDVKFDDGKITISLSDDNKHKVTIELITK
jgi:hypothetical protein